MTEKLAIEWRKLASLKPYAKNARSHSDLQVQKIANVIKEVGWTKPIVIDEKGTILAGHGAVLAAKLLGMANVPCVVKAGLTADQKRAYILADNRVAEDSTWNIGVLGEELEELTKSGFDLSLTGFDEDELLQRAERKSSGVTEIETHELSDRFWISIRGPLKSQAKALQALRKATAGIEGMLYVTNPSNGVYHGS